MREPLAGRSSTVVAVVPVSGLAVRGIDAMMEAVLEAYAVWNTRIATAKLNRWLSGVTERHPPPAVSGRRIKLRYATQAKTRPPHIAIFGNQLDDLPVSYTRYLVQQPARDLPACRERRSAFPCGRARTHTTRGDPPKSIA